MCELQADEQIAVGVRPEPVAMRGDQILAKAGERLLRALEYQQLVGIGPSVLAYRDGFAAPDQLGAARAEIPPSPSREVARLAVRRPVPAFHRKDAEAIAHQNAVDRQRIGERGGCGWGELGIEPDPDSGSLEMCPKRGGVLEGGDPRIRHAAHQTVSRVFCSTASAPRMHARAESSARRLPHASGALVRMAAQNPEISRRLGDTRWAVAGAGIAARLAAVAGRVSDDSITAPLSLPVISTVVGEGFPSS